MNDAGRTRRYCYCNSTDAATAAAGPTDEHIRRVM